MEAFAQKNSGPSWGPEDGFLRFAGQIALLNEV